MVSLSKLHGIQKLLNRFSPDFAHFIYKLLATFSQIFKSIGQKMWILQPIKTGRHIDVGVKHFGRQYGVSGRHLRTYVRFWEH